MRRKRLTALFPLSNSHASAARVVVRLRVRLSSFVSLESEGAERRAAHQANTPRMKPRCCAACMRPASTSVRMPRRPALHRGDFGPRDRASGRGTGQAPDRRAFAPWSRRLSPPFIRTSSSHQRQPHIVGADGDPWPPGDGLRNHPQAPHRRLRVYPVPAEVSCSINRRL